MPLNERAIGELSRMGYPLRTPDLRRWDRMWDEQGEAFFWSFLDHERQVREQADRWYPLLRAYAAECQRREPSPDPAGFSPAHREQQRLLHEQMSKFVAGKHAEPLRNPHRVAIVSTSPVGLAAAEEVFGPLGLRLVILPDGESGRWFEAHQEAETPFWWHVSYSCVLRDRFGEYDRAMVEPNLPAPRGTTFWLLTESLAWGGLAGGATHDLWRWDGSRAVFVETVAIDSY